MDPIQLLVKVKALTKPRAPTGERPNHRLGEWGHPAPRLGAPLPPHMGADDVGKKKVAEPLVEVPEDFGGGYPLPHLNQGRKLGGDGVGGRTASTLRCVHDRLVPDVIGLAHGRGVINGARASSIPLHGLLRGGPRPGRGVLRPGGVDDLDVKGNALGWGRPPARPNNGLPGEVHEDVCRPAQINEDSVRPGVGEEPGLL